MTHHCEAELHPDCTGVAVHRHHRRLRRHRDERPVNLLAVCAFCHTAIHANPALSYERGLLVRSWEDPSDVPVRIDL